VKSFGSFLGDVWQWWSELMTDECLDYNKGNPTMTSRFSLSIHTTNLWLVVELIQVLLSKFPTSLTEFPLAFHRKTF
jgi:hypothetical protein